MGNNKNRPRSKRQLQVGEVLRQVLSELFMRGDVYNLDVQNISVTVSEVQVSPDLRNATVYIMPLGGNKADDALSIIKSAAPHVRSYVSHNANLRYVPQLTFKLDDTYENAKRIDDIFRKPKVQNDLLPYEE